MVWLLSSKTCGVFLWEQRGVFLEFGELIKMAYIKNLQKKINYYECFEAI
jgi:hypothetical protein